MTTWWDSARTALDSARTAVRKAAAVVVCAARTSARMATAGARVLVAYLALSATAVRPARAHGYLAYPAARNVQRNTGYCPSCLNAGGTDAVFAKGLPGRWGVCGDPYDSSRPHEKGPFKIAGTYKSGGTLDAKVTLTANHEGRWSLRLCTDPTKVTQRCFDKILLRRADGRGPFTPVPGEAYDFRVRYRLPKVRCARCVLQWTYETGNSCNPPGIAAPKAWLPSCAASTDGEQFWNCADIAIA